MFSDTNVFMFQEMADFAVIETIGPKGEPEVSAVPEIWIVGNMCWWPPKGCNVSQKSRTKAKPAENWERYEIKVLKMDLRKFRLLLLLLIILRPDTF